MKEIRSCRKENGKALKEIDGAIKEIGIRLKEIDIRLKEFNFTFSTLASDCHAVKLSNLYINIFTNP